MRDTCKPSCIDLIITDQPNLVLDSGVRDSLDSTVKHKIVFCKINFKIPAPPKYSRTFWYFNRAREVSIQTAISEYPWEANLGTYDPNRQVDILNQTILNIMSNFVPNEVKTVRPREPEWMNNNIKKLSRKKSEVFKRYKKMDIIVMTRLLLTALGTNVKKLLSLAKKTILKTLVPNLLTQPLVKNRTGKF